MSMHKIPLTQLEEDGLRAHGLDIGSPSQLSDVFRHGIKWALEKTAPQPEPSGLVEALRPIHAMILSALDRDAEEGRAARGEMAAELRAALSAQGTKP